MQITEQIIERISRRVFNTMFSPALRQSNVVIGGSGSSVSWADNAGHANSADTAGSASSVPWSGVSSKPHIPSVSGSASGSTLTITIDGTAYSLTDTNTWRPVVNNLSSTDTDKSLSANQGKVLKGYIDTLNGYFDASGNAKSAQKVTPLDGITYGAAWLQYKDKYADEASNPANAIGNPTADWYHHIVMNHGNSGGYFVDMALCFHSNAFYYRRIVNGTANDWVRVLDSGNSSVSKSGSTLTVKINGTEYSLTDTNTWRPVVNNLSSTDTTSSLSAAMGKDLYDYITTLQGYFDANGNAKSALKLTTVSKTAWGKTFWTSGGVPTSISGDMTSVGDISFAASGKNIGGVAYFDTENNRLGVGQSSPAYALDVNGGAAFAGDVLPNADYATTEYSLGSSSYRWDRLYARFVHLTGTAPAVNVGRTLNYNIALHWAADSRRGLYDYSKGWVIGTDGTNTFLMGGNVGIGTTSPGDDKLKVNGSIYTTVGLYSEGYLDTLSDQRFKDVVDYDAAPSIAIIANAPAIHFRWNDRDDESMHVGSISQYWQKVMPEATHMRNGKLGMSYDVIAMLNTIALARKVQELEEEIRKIKAS